MSQVRYGSLYERVLANSEKPDDQNECGCWLWTGRTACGYGRMTVRVPGKPHPGVVLAHRATEQHLRDLAAQLASDDAQAGDWWDTVLPTVTAAPLCPENETLDHLCCTQRCVNPDHWQPETRARNTQLAAQRRRT